MFGHEIEGENQLLELPTGKLLPQRFISDVGGGGGGGVILNTRLRRNPTVGTSNRYVANKGKRPSSSLMGEEVRRRGTLLDTSQKRKPSCRDFQQVTC